jgi:hypothetical protein
MSSADCEMDRHRILKVAHCSLSAFRNVQPVPLWGRPKPDAEDLARTLRREISNANLAPDTLTFSGSGTCGELSSPSSEDFMPLDSRQKKEDPKEDPADLLQIKLQINSRTSQFCSEYEELRKVYPIENTTGEETNTVLLRHGSQVRILPRSPLITAAVSLPLECDPAASTRREYLRTAPGRKGNSERVGIAPAQRTWDNRSLTAGMGRSHIDRDEVGAEDVVQNLAFDHENWSGVSGQA